MTILVSDSFSRANTTASTTIMGTGIGWGVASSDGNTWTKGGTATPNFQIVSNQGKITNTNTNVFCLLSSSTYGTSEVLVRVSTSSISASNLQGVLLRYASGANSYRCALTGGNTLQITKGSTAITGGTYSFTWTANTEYWIRFRAVGSTLTARVWADGTSEPTSWQITCTDATFATGQVGIYSSPDATGTTAVFDSFQANDTAAANSLTVYGTNVAASTITTAGQLATASGGSDISVTTKVGTSTGYSELPALGNAGPWAAGGSIGSPSGLGWLLDSSALFSQQIVAGNWTPIVQCRITAGTATATIYVRAYAYDTSNSTYTLIGSMSLAGCGLTTTQQVFTFSATNLAAFSFNATQKLYIDCWFNVTANSSGSSTAQISYKLSTSASSGVANDMQVTTPGYQAGSSTPTLATSPTTLNFSATVGGSNPANQNDTLSETGNASTAWTSSIAYSSGSGWLGISPTSGTLAALGTQTVAFSCTTGALAAGTYTATVTYTATTGGSTATVVVTFTVSGASTALTAYLSNTASVNDTEANQLYTIAGTPSTTTRDVIVGTALHYGELTAQGTTAGGTTGSPYGAVYYFSGKQGTMKPLAQKFIDLLVGGNGETGLVPGGPIWARPQVKWNTIEYAVGQYDWSIVDDMVSRCNAANILINFNLMIPPDWRLDLDINGNQLPGGKTGSANGGVYASGAQTTAYATLLAQRYNGASGHGTINCFQWNEDYDSYGATNAQQDNGTYAFVQNWQIVGPIFRKYCPSALLVGPASRAGYGFQHRKNWTTNIFTYTPSGSTWAGAIVDSHGSSILDALDFHYYRDGAQDTNGQIDPDPNNPIPNPSGATYPTPAQIIAAFQSIAAANGHSGFDVWCTETGWNVVTSPTKPNPYVTQAQQSQYILETFDQHRKNGGSHVFIWVINPNAIYDDTTRPPSSLEPKSIVFNIKSSGKFVKYQAYTDWQTYIGNYPNWGVSSGGGTWEAAPSMGAPTGDGWLLDPTTLEGNQFLSGTWTATLTLQAMVSGSGSGSLVADLYVRASKYNVTTGVYTPIATTTLAAQTIGSTSAAFTLSGSGIVEPFATGEKLYIDMWPNITTNSNANTNQAIRILKISLDTSGKTGDAGAAIVTPGYQAIVSATSVLSVSASALSFAAASGGASPASQTDTLSETNGVGTNWTSSISYNSGSGWLSISPTSGTLSANGNATITVSCTTGTLIAGTYSAIITFTAATGGATATITVTFVVNATGSALTTSPPSLSFHATSGGANPASQNGTLTNTGGTASAWTVAIAYGSGSGWLAISPSSGTLVAGASHTLTYTCTTGALAAGTYSATVTYTATVGGATTSATVTFVVQGASVLTIAVGGVQVVFDEDTFKFSPKLDERWRCQFTVLDYAGTQQFSYRQQVVVTDALLGILFTGFVADVKQDKTRMYPTAGIEHQLDCIDNRGLVDKRTSNFQYENQYAGTVAVHQAQTYLAAEGVTVAAALDWDETLTDWQAGTLTSVAATTNAMDANPGDGDLELALAGAGAALTETVSADWNNNVSISGLDTTTDILQLASHATLQMTGVNGGNYGGSFGNAFAYQQIWTGSYTIVSGDKLSYSVWVNSGSPQIMAGVDIIFTDGSSLRGSSVVDQNGIGAHPNNDLAGFANDQWYNRTLDMSSLAAKGLQLSTLGFEGDNAGTYTAYFRDIIITNGGVTKLIIYQQGNAPHASVMAPQSNARIAANGYSNVIVTPVVAYEQSGTRTAVATSLAGVGIYRTSLIAWSETIPVDSSNKAVGTIAINTSIDGGATWQLATLNSAIAGLMAGAALAGKTLQTQQILTMTAKDPTLSPSIAQIYWSVSPSYAATKKDVYKSYSTAADWSSGTLTNLTSAAANLTINASTRNWDDASTANQTLYGGSSPVMGTYKKQGTLTTNNSSTNDASIQFNFAGQWADFEASIDIQVPANGCHLGLIYRTTGWQNNNDTYAYEVDLSVNSLSLGRGTNSSSGSGTRTAVGSSSLTLTAGDWHTLTVIAVGSSHTILIDGVQYISATDGTYTGTGYLGVRNFNSSGSTQTGYFDNFGVMPVAAVSPNTPLPQWLSPVLNLKSITVGNSLVQWNATQPNGSIVNVLASINGGAYTACTNNAVIPGLTPGTILTAGTLQLKVQLQATTPAFVPSVQGLTVWVLSGYSASGTRVSPSTSLAAVGRAGTALVNWNANLPTNTGLTVATSIDGGSTYRAISSAGGSISGITVQPLPVIDGFSTNTSANYTSTAKVGGLTIYGSSVADATLATACDMAATTGGTETSVTTVTTGPNLYAEILSQGSASSSGASSIPATPTGHGWLYYPGAAGSFAAGNWSAQVTLAGQPGHSFGSSNPLTLRFFKLSGGVYTLIGTLGATTTSVSKTTYSFPATAMPAVTLGSTDALYIDLWFYDVTDISGDNPVVYVSSSSSQGVANDFAITMPPFVATWTQNLSTNSLSVTSGSGFNGALYIANSPTGLGDVQTLAILDQSRAGGIVLHYTNSSNFYYCVIQDNLSSGLANTVGLYKVAAGTTYTLVASAAISFVHGIPHQFIFQYMAGVLSLLMDGVQVASYDDSTHTPLTSGQSGLFNDTGTSRYYQLRIAGLGQNVSSLSVQTKVTLTSTDPTVTPQLLDMQVLVASPAIGAGTLIPSANYAYTFIDKNYDDLAKQSNYAWYLDQFKALNFQARQALPAPWVLSSNTLAQPSDLEIDSNLVVEIAGDLYRNRQVLTGVTNTIVDAQDFVGDGTTTSFTLGYPVAPGTIPHITLNEQVQLVGLKGSTGSDWYYAVGSTAITQDSGDTKLQVTDELSVAYTGTFITTVVVDNIAAQQALALVEGGSGIVEAVEDVSQHTSKGTSTPGMLYPAAVTYANQLLARYCITGRTLTGKTYRNGLAVGQMLTVLVPEEFLQNIALLITQLEITLRTQPGGTVLYDYLFTATELANMKSWQALLASGLLN